MNGNGLFKLAKGIYMNFVTLFPNEFKKKVRFFFYYGKYLILTIVMFLHITLFTFAHHDIGIYYDKLYPDYRNFNSSKIFVALVSMPGDDRQLYSRVMWADEMNKYTPHKVVYLCAEGKDFPETPYLHISQEYDSIIKMSPKGRIDRDRAIKRYVAAKYFYEETDFEWFLSATDDIYIDLARLPQIYDYLSQYDTNKDIVFKGHVIYYDKAWYLQGGSGYIYSRKAAKIFIDIGIDFIKTITYNDDLFFGNFTKIYNITLSDMATSLMHGHVIWVRIFSMSFFKKLPKCPAVPPLADIYGKEFFKIQDLVIFHTMYTKGNYLKYILKAQRMYDDVYLFHQKIHIRFCRK
jgi:hypothetical protein